MTFKTLVAGASAAVAAIAVASTAFAQAPAAAQPAARPATPQGPAINGLCVLSVDGAIAGSTVGKYANTRLQQIAQQVNAELTSEQTAIQNEDKTLSGQRATLDANTFEQRAAALQVRVNSLQRKAQLRERELQATQQKVRARLGQEIEPLIRTAYQQKGCSVLLDGNAVIDASPAMDITPQVVTALNGKITQFAFDRERLDQPAPTASATPAPTAAAPAPARR
jgi:outer membrane protein